MLAGMLRFAALGAFAVLSACEAVPPPPPPPHIAALQSQCQGGSTQACGLLVQADNGRRMAAAQAYAPPMVAYAPPQQYPGGYVPFDPAGAMARGAMARQVIVGGY